MHKTKHTCKKCAGTRTCCHTKHKVVAWAAATAHPAWPPSYQPNAVAAAHVSLAIVSKMTHNNGRIQGTCRNNVSKRATVGCSRAIVDAATFSRSSFGDTRIGILSISFAKRASSWASSSSPARDSSEDADTTPMRRPFRRFCRSPRRLLSASVLERK